MRPMIPMRTIAMRLIRENPAITQKEMKDEMGVSLVTIKRLMADLKRVEKSKDRDPVEVASG
jgi:Trp operon repressor